MSTILAISRLSRYFTIKISLFKGHKMISHNQSFMFFLVIPVHLSASAYNSGQPTNASVKTARSTTFKWFRFFIEVVLMLNDIIVINSEYFILSRTEHKSD